MVWGHDACVSSSCCGDIIDGILDCPPLVGYCEACTVIADPLFKPLLKNKKLIRLPHEAFSGRLYRDEIPDLITDTGWLSKCMF